MFLLLLLIVSQMDFIIGSFLPAEDEKKFGFVGYSREFFPSSSLTIRFLPARPSCLSFPHRQAFMTGAW